MTNYDYPYIEPEILEQAKKYPCGLILVSGVTFSGVTTTAQKMFHECRKETPEIKVADVSNRYDYNSADSGNVISVGVAIDPYKRLMHAALASDPDIVYLGEIRDKAKGKWSGVCVQSGHKAIAEVHAYSVSKTLERYCAMTDKADLPSLGNVLVVSQFLLRRADGTRVAIREFLALDPEHLQALAESDDLSKTAYILSQTYGQSFHVSAQKLHAKGWICDEELEQVKALQLEHAEAVGV